MSQISKLQAWLPGGSPCLSIILQWTLGSQYSLLFLTVFCFNKPHLTKLFLGQWRLAGLNHEVTRHFFSKPCGKVTKSQSVLSTVVRDGVQEQEVSGFLMVLIIDVRSSVYILFCAASQHAVREVKFKQQDSRFEWDSWIQGTCELP